MRRVLRLNIRRLKKFSVFLYSYFRRFWMPIADRDWHTKTIEVSTVFTRVLFFSCLPGEYCALHQLRKNQQTRVEK